MIHTRTYDFARDPAGPLRWREPCRARVLYDGGDPFGVGYGYHRIAKALAVAANCTASEFVFATALPDRMAHCLVRCAGAAYQIDVLKAAHSVQGGISGGWPFPIPNVTLAAVVHDQATADDRVPHLLRCPAARREVWVDGMTGPMDLGRFLCCPWCSAESPRRAQDGKTWHLLHGTAMPCPTNGRGAAVHNIDAVAVSGGDAPLHPDWVRAVRDQCAAAGVPFTFGGWGRWQPLSTVDGRQVLPFGEYVLPNADGTGGFGLIDVGRDRSGRTLDGRTHDGVSASTAGA